MASEHIAGPPNGLYGTHHVAHPSAAAPSVPQSVSPAPKQHPSQNPNVSKEEVAWYFVERYYNTLSKKPAHLHLFFSKQSQFVTGVEEEKVQVYHGQRSINDKIQELDYQDCKVRVTNVDSQTSGENIVVQVIGEISNKAQPHRKFVQTFVLAPQTNGYFVLNDIFRTMADEDDPEAVQPATAAATGVEVDASASAKPDEAPANVDVAKVDEQLEQYAREADVKVNGDATAAEAAEAAEALDDAPAVAVAVAAVEAPVVEAEKVEEKPKEPVPTPVQDTEVAPKPQRSTPVPAPKPSAPKTWAQLARDSSSTTLAAPAATSTLPPPPTPAKSASQSPAPGLTPSPGAPAAAPPAASPARQPSPADSLQEGSSGGWITAEHNRSKSRTQPGPAVQEDGRVRAYVKNVFQGVDIEQLRAELSKYGELAYFDVSRTKNSAFVEFTTLAGFNAAVAANPHKMGSDNVFVEERRPPVYASRGGARGGRGGFDGRPSRGGFMPKGDGAPRGGFAGRARGGANSMNTRPRAQAA